jgi:hypothetical protein
MNDLRESLERARRRAPSAPGDPFERLMLRRERKVRNGRIAAATLSLVIAAAAIGGAVLALRERGGGDRTPVPADEPVLVAETGQYYYTRSLLYSRDDPCDGCPDRGVLGPWTIEVWFGPDGSGRAVFVDAPEPEGSVDYGWPGAKDRTYGPGAMPLEDLSNLSSDPAELRAQLTERSMPGGASPNPVATTSPGRSKEDTAVLRTFQDLFDGGEQFTPPLVRAAMFDVARDIEGVETMAETIDPVGRPAVSLRWVIQYEGPPSQIEWFFDPDTKQLMAETWTQEGRVLQARIVTNAGITDSTEQPPAAEDLFFPAAEGHPSFAG